MPPPRLPLEKPIGPQLQEEDWTDLGDFLGQALEDLPNGHEDRLAVLDKAYSRLARAAVTHISRATDTPLRHHHCRLQPPTIKRVTKEERQKRAFKSWRCLLQPLGWLQSVLFQAHQAITQCTADTLDQLQDELGQPPVEYHTHPGLMGLLTQARTILEALAATSNPLTSEEQIGLVDRFLEQLRTAITEEQQAQNRTARQQWRQWVHDSMGTNLGWAHKWTKLAAVWKPPASELSTDNRPTAKLEREAARLSQIWGSKRTRGPTYRATQEAIDGLPPITVQEFRRAINTFPRRTSSTWDGLHPRHFALLTDAQIEVVIKLMRLIEQVGEMPTCLQGIVATLIPKLKGDLESFRSIGMMPGLYRAWARCRAPIAKQWERAHKHTALGHQSGRSLLELVFMQAMLAEAGSHDEVQEFSACFMWDLSNYYEHVPRDTLWDHGQILGFNAGLLAVILNQYSSQRVVAYNGVAQNTYFPSRGLAAGCGFATFLVQVLAIPALDKFQALHPQVWITMFIDDLLVQARHRLPAQVVSRLTEAGAALHDIITNEWECKVAQQKSVLLASSRSLSDDLRKAFGHHAGKVQESATNLGVDTWMGKRRRPSTLKTLSGRFDKLRRRGRKLRALKEASSEPLHMVTLYKTGLQSFGFFGSEVVGMTDQELHRAQHHYLTLCGCPGQAKSKHLSLCLLSDPSWRQAVGPILVWASIVWKASTSPDLFAVWPLPWLGREAGKVIRSLPRTWAEVRGPLGAAYLSLRRLGWTFVTPFQISTDDGAVISLTDTSPEMVAYWLRTASNKQHLDGAKRTLHLDPALQIDFEVARKLLLDRRLAARERGVLHKYLTQAL